MKKFTAVLLSVLLLASSLPISALASEASETSETVAADIVKTEPETTDSVTQPIENKTTAEKTAVDEKPTEATPAKVAEPVGAKQEEKPVGKSSFTYTVTNNQVTITGLSDEYLTDLVIPETIEDLPVTAIKDYAFNGCAQITSIEVPKSVITIGKGAFKGTNPTKVNLPFIGISRSSTEKLGLFGIVFGYSILRSPETTYQYDEYNSYGRVTNVYCYIPKTIEEVIITDDTRVPCHAFYNCDWIKSISINENIETIEKESFFNCAALEKFVVPKTVTDIFSSAFKNCTALTQIILSDRINTLSNSIFYGCSKLQCVNFPKQLTIIESFAFFNCSSLDMPELIIPEGVTQIDNSAFNGCSTIIEIAVPNSVKSIGDGAFKGTNPTKVELPFVGASRLANSSGTNLFGYIFGVTHFPGSATTTQIESENSNYRYCCYIPKTIKEVKITDTLRIPANAFCNCDWIEQININNTVETIFEKAFYNCKSLLEFTIPDNVTAVKEAAFQNCTNLTDIFIPEGITIISERIFSGCKNLKSLIVPNGVTSINDNAFDGCIRLESISFPNSLTSIKFNAFKECIGLKNITIPSNVTSIDAAFVKCIGLERITVANDNPVFDSRNDCNAIIESSSNTLLYGCKTTKISNSITNIDQCAFSDCTGLQSINVPNSVVSIGAYAFSGCTGLQSISLPDGMSNIAEGTFSECIGLTDITFPKNLKTIEEWAFSGCTGLTTLSIPDGVQSIGYGAFCNCFGLISIYFPESVTDIESSAFIGCENIKSIKVADNNPIYDSRKDCNAIIETATNTLVYGCQNTVIPDSVLCIGDSAFCLCTKLMSITLPDSVISIEDSAFYGCNNLSIVLIPDSVEKIGSYALFSCPSLNSVTIPDNVTYIGFEALGYGQETPAVSTKWKNENFAILGKKGSSAERYATDNGMCFISIDDNGVTGNCTWQTDHNGVLTISGVGAMGDGSPWGRVQKIIIEKGVTNIGTSAFLMSLVEEISIPDSVTSIGYSAFASCANLKSAAIPSSVTSIGKFAFNDCISLKSIVIPSSVTSIGEYAFGYLYGTMDRIEDFIIYGYRGSEAEKYAAENDFVFIALDTESSIQLGDINQNGTVEIQDVTALQRHLAEFTNSDGFPIVDEENEEVFKIADVNHDGIISIADITTIQRYLAEFIDSFV